VNDSEAIRFLKRFAAWGRDMGRICMLTARGYAHNAFRCGFYEAQDVLAGVDDVDLIELRPKPHYAVRQPLQKYLVWHDVTGRVVTMNMVFEPVDMDGEYELFIAHFPHIQDLIQLSAVKGWKEHCRRSICWIDEVYAADVAAYKSWFSVLKDFNHVALGMSGTVETFSRAYDRPCHYVPGAVDALRFSPLPDRPAKVVDIYSIGRIGDGLHRALLDLAASEKRFYLHDTFLASYATVYDHRQHRQLIANTAKRSRYFHVAPAKMNVPEETRGQSELGFRYYEGSASGAVLIGQVPQCAAFQEMFGWPDSVIEINPDGSDAAAVLSRLETDRERVAAIGTRNAAEALRRHDWLYRWKRIYEIVGLGVTDDMKRREGQLNALAEAAGESA
jgi:hypothetical protein